MKAYKTEIHPTKDQIKLIHQTCGNVRYVYNQFIAFNFERLKNFLQQQCEKLGIELRLAPRFYPSSKLCSHCGYKNVDLKLKDRSWECPDCHVIHDRDENAAINLEQCTVYTVLTAV